MSKTTDKLIDDIIELILDDMDCHHEADYDEDGIHTSVEYSLNDEVKLREKIGALLKPGVTEEWIEKWRDYLFERFPIRITGNTHNDWLDELKQMLKEAGVEIRGK